MKTKAILLIAGLLSLASCKDESKEIQEPVLEENVVTTPVAAGPECFLNVTGRDSIIFQMERNGDSVTGVFNWKPYEKDIKLSNFKGTLINGKGKAIAQVSAEGINNSEELEFTLHENNTLSIKYGEMEQRPDGIWYYKSETRTSEQTLSKVDCP